MNFEMTIHEAAALARYVELIRKRVPGEAWHKPGIEDALGRARHRADSPDLAMAAIATALRPENRTPAIIGLDGPHWREATKAPAPVKVDANLRCSICSETEDRCRTIWRDDHQFETLASAKQGTYPPDSVARTVAALKDALVPTAPSEAPKTLDELEDRNPRLRARMDEVRAAIPGVVAADDLLREPEATNPGVRGGGEVGDERDERAAG